MTESQACPECGAEVPVGRLSCGACGALLASVQGRAAPGEPGPTRRAPAIAAGARPAARPDASDPAPAPTPVAGAGVPASDGAAPGAPHLAEIIPPPPPMPPLPGAYLPPSSVLQGPPVTPTLQKAQTPASAFGTRQQVPVASPPAPAADGPSPVAATRAPVLELPFVLAPGLGPRLVAAGAAVAVVAFVLPWIGEGGAVIGGSFGSGYFATWGLAAVGNVLPFLLAWVSLGLAVLPNPVPRSASLGALPVFLGGVFGGDAWTYLTAPAGMGPGLWALAVSAVLLAAGGSLVLRHAEATGRERAAPGPRGTLSDGR